MKKLSASLFVFVLSLLILFSCQKETSEESGGPSSGFLQSGLTGECLPKNVVGTYVQGTPLNGNNDYIEVTVDVETPGTYDIKSDTVQGIFFHAAGSFPDSGLTVVRLSGSGTPAASGNYNLNIRYNGQVCAVGVSILPSSTGGPAVFTLNGAGGNCTGAVPAGSYALGVALNSSNTVTINVNVTTIGTYSITAAGGGMTFAANSSFTTTGAQTVVLAGSGTPTTAGSNTIAVTAGTATCNFAITVGTAAAGTLGGGPGACTPFVVNGTYAVGTPLAGTNTVELQVTVTTPGVYSITTNTVNGVSFAGSGTFASAGAQPVTLTGTGTPVAGATFNFTVTFGTSTCSFPVTFTAPPVVSDYFPRTTNSNWSHDFDNVFNDSLYSWVIAPTKTVSGTGNVFNIFLTTQDITTTPDTLGYFRRSGGTYSRFVNLGYYLSFDADQYVEFDFLRDDQAAGFSWNSPAFTGAIGGTPITIRIKFTILQKDVSVNVKGVAYPNTIVVEEKYEALVSGVWTPLDNAFGYYRDYYSRNIGWIRDELYDPSSGTTPVGVMDLRRYKIF